MTSGPRHLLALPEDCAEFRMLRIGCGERAHEAWLRSFLEPEALDADDFIERLRREADRGSLDVTDDIARAQVLVVERVVVDAQLLADLSGLSRVVKYGSDLRNIDIEACRARGLSIGVASRTTTANVADHTMMLLLVVMRRFTRGARLESSGEGQMPDSHSTELGEHPETAFNWPGIHGIRAVRGMRLAVLGIGEIGRAVLERAAAFGMVLGYWSLETDVELERRLGVTRLEFGEVADWADVVSIHLPFAPELENLIDGAFLDDLGPEGVVINTARGLLVDTDALVAALETGKLGAAGLDVFPHEPLRADHPLRRLNNAVLTPHVGAGSRFAVLEDVLAVMRAAAETGDEGEET